MTRRLWGPSYITRSVNVPPTSTATRRGEAGSVIAVGMSVREPMAISALHLIKLKWHLRALSLVAPGSTANSLGVAGTDSRDDFNFNLCIWVWQLRDHGGIGRLDPLE